MGNAVQTTNVVGLPPRPEATGLGGVHLVGRDRTLLELDDALSRGVTEVTITSGAQGMTLHGLGGIGKTALALEYCHRSDIHEGRYALIWWVNADSDATAAASCRELGAAYGVELDERFLVEHTSQLLGRVGPWLAVYDNVSDKRFFDQWRVNAPNGQLLITSRTNTGWSNAFSIDLLTPEDSLSWLLTAAGNPDDINERLAAYALVSRLDGLPLALTMATSFLSAPHTRMPLRQYGARAPFVGWG